MWLLWGGLVVAFLGFTTKWTTDVPFGWVQYLHQDAFETLGTWLMRLGFAGATAGAAAALVLG